MASGDKLFIADKATLDIVRGNTEGLSSQIQSTSQKVDRVSTTTDNIHEMTSLLNEKLNTVSSNVSAIQSSNDTGSLTVSDLSRFVSSSATVPVGTTYANILELTGPGKLHYATALARYATNVNTENSVYLQILVDGVVVLNGGLTRSTSQLGTYIGYSAVTSFVGVDTNGNPKLLNNLSLGVDTGSQVARVPAPNSAIVISLKPIQWNNSLLIRAYTTNQASTLSYYYEKS